MPFELPALPYDHAALEPHIDAKTMEIHHGKHHAAYVTNLNAALEGTEWADRPLDAILSNLDLIPEDKRMAVRNNGGGHANHTLFWTTMSPDGGGEPEGDLADAIAGTFGERRRPEGRRERRWCQALRLGLDLARLGRDGHRRQVDAEPGRARDGGRRRAPRNRRLGARVLPQLPEPPPRLSRRLVERRRLGRGRSPLRRGDGSSERQEPRATPRLLSLLDDRA